MNTAGERAVHGKLSLHLISTMHLVMLADVILLVVNSFTAVKAEVACDLWRPCAITANIDVCALALQVVSGVLLT